MAKLLVLSFFLAATKALITRENYNVVTRYDCWKEAEVFLDRGIVLRFDENFLHRWPGKSGFDCEMPISNNYKSPGIISVVQHLKFRKTGKNCTDHIKFGKYDRERCGEMIMGQIYLSNGTWNTPKFISEFAGLFLGRSWRDTNHLLPLGAFVYPHRFISVLTHVDETPLLQGERLAFLISFTGFVECDGLNVTKGLFNCGYGVCILEMFVGDGIVNCPFGDCRDEGNCDDALENINTLTNGSYHGGSRMENSTAAAPMISRPFRQWLQNNEEGTSLSMGRREKKVVQELENIRKEITKNTGYLERMINILEGKLTSQAKNMTGA